MTSLSDTQARDLAILEGLADAEAGRTLTHAEVLAWVRGLQRGGAIFSVQGATAKPPSHIAP